MKSIIVGTAGHIDHGKTALVKAEMRILRRIVGDDPDAAELFQIARSVARKRVVQAIDVVSARLGNTRSNYLCSLTPESVL